MRRVIVPLAAGAVLVTAAVVTDNRQPRAARSATPAATAAPGEGMRWLSNEAEARRLAEEKKLPMIIDFFADWCGPCHDLEATVFSHPEFLKRRGNFVALRYDVTLDNAENTAILSRYRVTGLPTIVFLDRDGKTRRDARIEGAAPLGEFLRTLDSL